MNMVMYISLNLCLYYLENIMHMSLISIGFLCDNWLCCWDYITTVHVVIYIYIYILSLNKNGFSCACYLTL